MIRVGIRCDAGPRIGVGHLMRCLALAEELLLRGVSVTVLGDLGGVAWAGQQVAARGLSLRPGPGTPEELVTACRGLDAVVLDSYTLDPRCAGALREAGVVVLAVVDGSSRGQSADLFLDQNIGARGGLAGLDYVLLRDSVRAAGPLAARGGSRTPEVLCFFGGTDAGGAAPVLARALAATGVPFSGRIVTSVPDAVEISPSITALAPTDALPSLAARADLVVTACGSGVWEMLYLGVPTALVWVAENQRESYARVVGEGLAAGLGHVDEVRSAPDEAVVRLRALLTDQDLRTTLAARGRDRIDGRGRERVADALLRSVPR